MRTPLTDFSQDFCDSLLPLLAPFEGVVDELHDGVDEELGRELLPDLRRVRDQLGVLLRKVEEQQAYVMIFGPLKSGKSTLMNALAGTYVSEVTSLPAYPTVVFVSHAEAPSYRVTRYDGSSEEPPDAEALRATITQAHTELAQAMRAAELDGRMIDPPNDLPRALRRVDVALPAGDLAPAEVVLVDTPGLYTRMKFGYDSMTRDFKHAASVAVFVVKADNLFLEQVFAEFSDLLDLFSRVFLVLNVDSSRVDLGPDGELVPSLEQREPDRIVRAFEELSMNARLKQATDEGRLCIYPVDLLQAASARLRHRGAPEPTDSADFERFRADLTTFLESNDYLNAFVSDGLTRAGILLDELEGVCSRTAVRHFVRRLKELAAERDRERGLLRDARALHGLAWELELGDERHGVAERARERGERVLDEMIARSDEALDTWFASSASLQQLVDESLAPIAAEARAELRAALLGDLRARANGGAAGLGLEADVQAQVEHCGPDLVALGRELLEELADLPPGRLEIRGPISAAQVPVKRRLGDWLLLRKRETVRRRLLGPDRNPDQRVAPALKSRLLGPPAREAMREAIATSHEGLVAATLEQLDRDVREIFAAEMEQRVRAALAERIAALEPRVEELVAAVARQRTVMTRIDELRSGLRDARAGLQVVRTQSAPTLREVEIVPAAPPPAPELAEQPVEQPAEATSGEQPVEQPVEQPAEVASVEQSAEVSLEAGEDLPREVARREEHS